MGNELGQIKEGYLADLLLVDGDPIANVRILQDKDRLLAIMKDGKFHKKPQMQEAAAAADGVSRRQARGCAAMKSPLGRGPDRRSLAALLAAGCSSRSGRNG